MEKPESVLVNGVIYYSEEYINRQVMEQKAIAFDEGFKKGKTVHVAEFKSANAGD